MDTPSPARPSLLERDARVIANIGKLRFSPLCLIGARGNRLIEEGGRELLDLSASFGPAILGYSHPAIRASVDAACAGMAGASLLAFPNENAVALAEELLRLTPGRGERRVWFGHSGSDANDCAMRVVQAATGRSRFISFIGSYHGSLSGSKSTSPWLNDFNGLPSKSCVIEVQIASTGSVRSSTSIPRARAASSLGLALSRSALSPTR